MLMEGLVGIVALIAAAALPNAMYYDINIDLAKRPQYAQALKALEVDPHGDHGSELVAMEESVQESLHGRTGGAVTLAVGMARIFTQAIPGRDWLVKYWYHFAIMFEALFILTTIDTGTRIGRFLLQEFLGKVWKPLGDLDWLPASILATGLITLAWSMFIYTGSVETIWPMFGMANQLLAVIALGVATTVIINAGRRKYAWTTFLPMLFVATTTTTTGFYEIRRFARLVSDGKWTAMKGGINIGLTVFLLACVAVILGSAAIRWSRRPGPGAGPPLTPPA
jgi:carbon starvation protein